MIALSMAWLADRCGSAMIIGAFAAGCWWRRSRRPTRSSGGSPSSAISSCRSSSSPSARRSISSALNPLQPASRFALVTGGVLIVVGVVGKLAGRLRPFWFRGNKTVIGVGMIPAARSA